jgi:nicotinic acid mononucleotide adenylyltransferase
MWNAPAGLIAVHEGRLLEISATDIRGRIRAKQSIHALVPSKVENYIGQHALYKETGETNLRQHN